MKLTLGLSPCPNDTFIFDALVHGAVADDDVSFDVVLEDVETLNAWALEGRLDVSKISYGVLPLVAERYHVLSAGGALGQGVGPLLVARGGATAFDPASSSVALPGEHTTAHLLFSLAYPNAARKRFVLFSRIEDAVLRGEVDAGVIIHESRFTYASKGLVKLVDLGEHWERETRSPIPLGGIVVRRSLDAGLQRRLDALVRRSLEHAFSRYPELGPFVREHAQAMDEAVMRRHIDLYVNRYSLDLGPDGRRAVETLFEVYRRVHPGAPVPRDVFVDGRR